MSDIPRPDFGKWRQEIADALHSAAQEACGIPKEAKLVQYAPPKFYYWMGQGWVAVFRDTRITLAPYKKSLSIDRMDIPLSVTDSDILPYPKAKPGQRVRYASYVPREGEPRYHEETIKSVQVYNDNGYWTMAYVYDNRGHGSIHTTSGDAYETMEVIG